MSHSVDNIMMKSSSSKVFVFFMTICLLLVFGQDIRRTPGQPIVDEEAQGIDTKNSSKVWGPGLKPHLIVLPARYFYVKLLPFPGVKYATTIIVKIFSQNN